MRTPYRGHCPRRRLPYGRHAPQFIARTGVSEPTLRLSSDELPGPCTPYLHEGNLIRAILSYPPEPPRGEIPKHEQAYHQPLRGREGMHAA